MIFRKDNNGLLYKIKVKDEDNFLKAQLKGSLTYIQVDNKSLPNSKFREIFYKIEDDNIVVDMDRTFKKWIELKQKEIRNFLYSKYPQSKQSSDLADKMYFENVLKAKVDADGAKVYPDLETIIVAKVIEFDNGSTLDDLLSDVVDEDKESIKQLLKVGIRVSWVQKCKSELKSALAEDREPNYPAYPLV